MPASPGTLAVLTGLTLCLAAAPAPQSQGQSLTVTKKETKLRSAKRLLSKPVADLREGDKLVASAGKDGAWVPVTFGDKRGFVHESDVSTKADVRLSGQGVRENYTVSETAAARKGFNPQVEGEYRKQNPDLNAAFAKVDVIQERTVREEDVAAFLRTGGLLKETQQ